MNPQLTCSQRQCQNSSVGRAWHWYGEVTCSNLGEVLNFFQASLRNCINCVHYDDHFFISICYWYNSTLTIFVVWKRVELWKKKENHGQEFDMTKLVHLNNFWLHVHCSVEHSVRCDWNVAENRVVFNDAWWGGNTESDNDPSQRLLNNLIFVTFCTIIIWKK